MGLFSFRKKDAEAVPPKRGSRRSGRTGTRTAGGGEYSEHEQLDPLLPEKQRARRRLVGALALVLAAVIILPMVLAPEPKPTTDDIAIQIPGKDAASPPVKVKPAVPTAGNPSNSTANNPSGNTTDTAANGTTSGSSTSTNASNTASTDASLDKGEQVEPDVATKPVAVTPPPVAAPKPEVHAEVAKPAVKPDVKPDTKPEVRADTKPTQKPAQNSDPIAQFAQNAPTAPAKPADSKVSSNGKYMIRIGAFSSEDRAQAWLIKLKLVNVPSYMEKKKIDDRQLYLLRAGPFPNRDSAESAGKKIRDIGLTAQVVEAG